jgi:hypothetical protein
MNKIQTDDTGLFPGAVSSTSLNLKRAAESALLSILAFFLEPR